MIKVDDEVISDKTIAYEMLLNGYEVDEEMSLRKGQMYTMTVIANNSIGFVHHYIIDHWVAGTNSQGEPYNREQIFSADGKLLWDSYNE